MTSELAESSQVLGSILVELAELTEPANHPDLVWRPFVDRVKERVAS